LRPRLFPDCASRPFSRTISLLSRQFLCVGFPGHDEMGWSVFLIPPRPSHPVYNVTPPPLGPTSDHGFPAHEVNIFLLSSSQVLKGFLLCLCCESPPVWLSFPVPPVGPCVFFPFSGGVLFLLNVPLQPAFSPSGVPPPPFQVTPTTLVSPWVWRILELVYFSFTPVLTVRNTVPVFCMQL